MRIRRLEPTVDREVLQDLRNNLRILLKDGSGFGVEGLGFLDIRSLYPMDLCNIESGSRGVQRVTLVSKNLVWEGKGNGLSNCNKQDLTAVERC